MARLLVVVLAVRMGLAAGQNVTDFASCMAQSGNGFQTVINGQCLWYTDTVKVSKSGQPLLVQVQLRVYVRGIQVFHTRVFKCTAENRILLVQTAISKW